MDPKQAVREFWEQWESRTGDKSAFAKQQTPFVREGWLAVRPLPGEVVDAVLEGVSEKKAGSAPRKPLWPAVLPAPLCALACLCLPVPGWVGAMAVAASGAAGIGLAVKIQRELLLAADEPDAEPELEPEAVEKALDLAEIRMAALTEHLSSIEKDAALGHDATGDKELGLWVQKFLTCAQRRQEDSSLQMLRDELIGVLENMGITVYDELLLNDKGEPELPDAAYYRDEREGEAYTRVKRPVVYSRRKLLAQGSLK